MKKITRRYLVLILSWLVYGLTTILFIDRVGPSIIIASVIPILISGLLLGMAGGILSGLLVALYNMIFLGLVNPPFITVFGNFPLWFGSTIGIVIGGVVGRNRDLTSELRKREHVREESLERFRDTFDGLPEGASIVDFDWRYVYVNKIVASRRGLKPEDFVGKHIEDIFTNFQDYDVYPVIKRCIEERRYGSIKAEVPRSGNGKVFVEFSIQPIPEGAFILSIDRTEQRRAQSDLLKSEEEYRSFMDNSPLFVTIYQDNAFKYANKTVIDRLGYSFQEITDPSFSPIDTWVAPRFRKQAYANRDKRLAGETVPSRESALITRSGEEIIHVVSQRTITFEGRPALEFVMEDVTERKEAENALRESEIRYRGLFDSSAVGNWSQDITNIRSRLDKLRDKGIKDLREYFSKYPEETRKILKTSEILDVNETALEIFGADSKEQIRKGEVKIFSNVPLETRIDYLVTIAEGGRHWEMEAKCNTLDGREINVRTYSSIPGRDIEPQLLIMSVIDITESKRYEAEKLSAVGKAAASIAHDVRNPLTAIRNAAYIIRSAKKEKRDEMLEVIDNNTVRADNIIQSLMDFSSPAPLETTEVNFNTALDEILAQTVIPENVKLTKKYDNNLAARFDKSQMNRALSNLIMNALQAMPKGGRLTVSSKQVDGFIETQIIDTGVGIPKKNLAKLFTPFFTTKAKGTGLGLPNAEAIIQRHKGTLKVESIEKKSTTVTVRLPALNK